VEDTRKKYVSKIAFAVLAFLLISSIAVILSNSGNAVISPADWNADYGDLSQYEWTQLGANGGWQLHSEGPAPNKPNVLWTAPLEGGTFTAGFFSVGPVAFNDKVFTISGNRVHAWNPFTGEELYQTDEYPYAQSSPTKIDDTYMFIDYDSGQGGLGNTGTMGQVLNGSIAVLRISDGSFVAGVTITGIGFQPGSGGYFPGRYDESTKIKLIRGYNAQNNECCYYGVDLSDPTNPTVAWKTILDESGEELAAADGKAWVGTVNGAILCFNDTNGDILYRVGKIGFAQYTATYIDGKLIQTSASTRVTCYDADTGDVLWDKDQGGRSFFAFAGCTAYGRFYQHNIAVFPEGFVGCWDVETGDMLWKQPALYQIGYITPVVADGKLYLQRISGTAAGIESEQSAYACFDAFTGELIWQIDGVSISNPCIAYGNLYGYVGSSIYCFSDSDPADWAMWHGGPDVEGVAQSTGPTLSNGPAWTFQTDGAIIGSAVVSDGKVVFGSQDKNIYCLDAYTGAENWRFQLETRAYSTPAIVGDRVYTGADDGNVYCLDAATGEVVWEKFLTSETEFVFAMTWQPRSSPLIVGSRLFVGAVDGKMYCLSTSNGNVLWSYDTGLSATGERESAIGGSPAYSNGVVFISSTNHKLFALNANDGTLKWIAESNASATRAYTDYFPMSTPTIGDGKVFWGAGPVYGQLNVYCLNETDGSQIWMTRLSGNTPLHATPVYVPGFSYTYTFPNRTRITWRLDALILPEFMGVSVWNATNGEKIWNQWLGHEVYSSPAYANDIRGPRFYVGSNTYSITCFNATAAFLDVEGGTMLGGLVEEGGSTVLGLYTTESHIQASPAIWDGKVYIGSADGIMYMFDEQETVAFSISSAANKVGQMWNNETLEVCGSLLPDNAYVSDEGVNYGSTDANGLPGATVKMSLTKPDGTDVSLETTTDDNGYFSFSYSPTDVGEWGWVVYFDGGEHPWINYDQAYGEWTPISVNSPTAGGGSTPPPSGGEEGFPLVYVYVAVAVVVIVIVAFAAYILLRKK
jgi:outer membrane protein assembly factor BamB